MSIEFVQVASATEVGDLRRSYRSSLNAPCDGMWEALATASSAYEIRCVDRRAGYLLVDDEGRILEFHVLADFEDMAGEAFELATGHEGVIGALVSTAAPLFLSLSLDRQVSSRVHTLLYEPLPSQGRSLDLDAANCLTPVAEEELDSMVAFQTEALQKDLGAWLESHLKTLIGRGELYALRQEGELLGTGEARVSESQPPFVDLGVIASIHHRGQGVATRILTELSRRCLAAGQTPICSTTVENRASQNAIERSGFVARHRMLAVVF